MSLLLPRIRPVLLFSFLFLSLCPPLCAQKAQLIPRIGLSELTRRAGYIFTGTVTAVAPVKTVKPNQAGSVQITFHVDRAIRGVRTGQSLSIREWAGLWQSGEQYRVGQRMLLFLYHPSKLGLSSAVGGAMGRVPLDSKGRVAPGFEPWRQPGTDPDGDGISQKFGRQSSHDLLQRIWRATEEQP